MVRWCSRLWLAVATLPVLWLPLAAQDQPTTTNQDSRADSQDGALRALVEQYFAAYARKDLAAMTALWSSNSPDVNPRRKELEKYFAENDKITFAHVEIHPASGSGEQVRLRASAEISAVDAKTGKTSATSGKVERVFEFVQETGSWKVWREKDAFDDFAERLVEETNESARTALSKNRGDLAAPPLVRALYKLGGEHRSAGDLVKARRSFQLMQQLAEETGDQRGICLAIRNIGILSDMQGDHRQALEYLDKSLDVAEALGDKGLIAGSLMILGIIHGGLSDNAEALRYFKRSLEMAESLNDKNLMAKVLANIGEVNRRQGNDSEALEYLQRSLAIDEAEKHDAIQIAITLSNLGSLYRYEGNHARALECFQRSLAILEHGRDAALLRSLLHNMGALYESQGDFDEALDYYQKSLAISNQLGEKDALADNLKSIGYVEEMREHFSIAMEYFQKGLALTEETGDKWESIFLLSRVGEVQAAESRYSEALSTYQKSLALAEELGIQAGVAQNCNNMAQLYYKQNRFQEALEFAQRAASLTLKNGDRESFWGASTLEGIAYRRLGQADQAYQAFEQAIATIEELRGQVAGGEEQEQVFFEDKLAPYHGMVELLVARNQLPEALSYAERAKGQVLLQVLASGRVNVGKAMTSAEHDREQQLQGELVSLNRQVSREMAASRPDQQHLSALQDNLNKARLQYADFQTNLYADHPELKTQRGQVQPISLREAGDVLPDSQGALLEFVVTDEKTYLFVLTRSSGNAPTIPELKVYTIDIKAKDLDREAKQFRQQLARRDLQFRVAAAKLFGLLLQPARAQLTGKTALVIVPDGPLWNLPFQALQARPEHYLLEDNAVAYAPSLTVLREMVRLRLRNNTAPTPQASQALLAMGNPALGKETSDRAKLTYRDEKLDPLPEAEKEVKTLGRLYGINQSKVYVGAEAAEDRFKAHAAEFKTLHLATHGVLIDSSPMYSHVLLSAGGPGSKEDGLLEAWEIMRMDLKADLVVLSACETARGRVSAGEGVIGLTWAFFVAGVPTTVVSQWKVESASTAKLMLGFHRTLKARESRVNSAFATARALQHAEVQLLHDPQYAHPFYWAGFVVMGDPR